MEKRLIKKDALAGIARKMTGDFAVWAPVKKEDNVLFAPLGPGDEPFFTYLNSKNAPKNVFFPHTETMMKYTRTPQGMVFSSEVNEAGQSVLFGVRPCDAHSFVVLDKLFDQEKYRDQYYIAKRQNTTVITLACVKPPYVTCFCTSVDGEPVSSEGADILLTDIGDEYLVEIVTEKGAKLAGYFGDTKADTQAEAKKAELAAKAKEAIKSKIPAHEVKPILDKNFDHPFWDTIHAKCLACGTCTYLCPTCHCFDISDEVIGSDGIRLRSWDSCMFPLFTKETSGHNPRPSQKERWRQRTMHKFKYYIDMFNTIGCVGCGRCVMYCPVNLDIRKVVEDISKL
ncbi:MAG TPA: 4Fe-4S dicluster domain-containing protein [Smithellaceae bacterium]|jgi:ferredoxin|nr:4Fe-4S dicluster domain-containing protein [Smithellaceae bacterium]HQF83893.1 4Fe-4S dicluster domain-containing protein [Smithellaceae bacterium]HQG80172.1 4Fe-4S dicluster domain-containing protein [Smithellaceae bacterium]